MLRLFSCYSGHKGTTYFIGYAVYCKRKKKFFFCFRMHSLTPSRGSPFFTTAILFQIRTDRQARIKRENGVKAFSFFPRALFSLYISKYWMLYFRMIAREILLFYYSESIRDSADTLPILVYGLFLPTVSQTKISLSLSSCIATVLS